MRAYRTNLDRHRILSDSHDIKHSPIFNADPVVGLGTFPNASTNFELSDGAFRDIIRAYPLAHHIQRNYTLRVSFCELPRNLFSRSNFVNSPLRLLSCHGHSIYRRKKRIARRRLRNISSLPRASLAILRLSMPIWMVFVLKACTGPLIWLVVWNKNKLLLQIILIVFSTELRR